MSHSGCCGGGNHDEGCSLNPATDRSADFSLYTRIHWENFKCLNADPPENGRKVFKPWEDRLSDTSVSSEVDGDIIFNIPFAGEVKLQGMILVAPQGGSHPTKAKLFKAFIDDFDSVQGPADQEIDLNFDEHGVIEYPIKTTKFQNVAALTIYIPGNVSRSDTTTLSYIGLRGVWRKVKKQGIVLANYEVTPNISEHKMKFDKILPQIM